MWDKYDRLVLRTDTPAFLSKLKTLIIDSGLEIIPKVSMTNETISFVSGGLELQVLESGHRILRAKVDASLTVLEEEYIKYIQKDSSRSFDSKEVIDFFTAYGQGAKKWGDKTTEELDSYLQKITDYGMPSLVFFDALQEAIKRDGLEKIRIKFPRINPGFCLDIYAPMAYSIVYRVYRGGVSEKVYLFGPISEKKMDKHFIVYNDTWFFKDQDFVKLIPGVPCTGIELIPGRTIQEHVSYPSIWYFTTYFRKLDCGHWEINNPDTSLCSVCKKDISPTGSIINEYSTKAQKYLGFLSKKLTTPEADRKTTYFGAEIELENGGEKEAILLYKELKGFLICKSDGSLSHGIEINTAPAVYEVHREQAMKLFTIIGQTGLANRPSCGLHFHVSKQNQTSLQIGRQLEFLYNVGNEAFLFNIAGRGGNRFASMEHKKSITHLAPEIFDLNSQNKYEILNLHNRDTTEFRIFASTTEYEVYMHRLEFVKALVDYTAPCAVNVKSLKDLKEKDVFVAFIESNRKTYPFLARFLGLTKPVPEQFKLPAGNKKEMI